MPRHGAGPTRAMHDGNINWMSDSGPFISRGESLSRVRSVTRHFSISQLDHFRGFECDSAATPFDEWNSSPTLFSLGKIGDMNLFLSLHVFFYFELR